MLHSQSFDLLLHLFDLLLRFYFFLFITDDRFLCGIELGRQLDCEINKLLLLFFQFLFMFPFTVGLRFGAVNSETI